MQEKAQNNMAKVAKTQKNKKKKKSPISKENQNKILRAYIMLYNAFSQKNLLSGMTLGAASYNALQLLQAKISAMDKKNPVTKLLRHIHKYHTKVISKHIMTSPFRDMPAKISPEHREKIAKRIPELFKTGNSLLNAMSAFYKPKAKPISKAQQFIIAEFKVASKPVPKKENVQQKRINPVLLLQIKMQEARRQRAA